MGAGLGECGLLFGAVPAQREKLIIAPRQSKTVAQFTDLDFQIGVAFPLNQLAVQNG